MRCQGCREPGQSRNSMQRVEGFLLGLNPRPRVVFSSEENDGCNDVGVVGNEFTIEVRKAKEGAYSFDRGWGMPVFDGSKFRWVHVNKTLTNNHPQVFHGGSVEGPFRDFEGKAMFPETSKDSTSSLMM